MDRFSLPFFEEGGGGALVKLTSERGECSVQVLYIYNILNIYQGQKLERGYVYI